MTGIMGILFSMITLLCISQFNAGYLSSYGIPAFNISSTLSFSTLSTFLVILCIVFLDSVFIKIYYTNQKNKTLSPKLICKSIFKTIRFFFCLIFFTFGAILCYQYCANHNVMFIDFLFSFLCSFFIYKLSFLSALLLSFLFYVFIMMGNKPSDADNNVSSFINRFIYFFNKNKTVAILICFVSFLFFITLISSAMNTAGEIFSSYKTYYPSFVDSQNNIQYIVIAEVRNHDYLCVDVNSLNKDDISNTRYIIKDLEGIPLKNYQY